MDLPCWEVLSWPGGGVLKFLQEKLKEAYKWERDHAPESGVDYDMLIWAVENLNG